MRSMLPRSLKAHATMAHATIKIIIINSKNELLNYSTIANMQEQVDDNKTIQRNKQEVCHRYGFSIQKIQSRIDRLILVRMCFFYYRYVQPTSKNSSYKYKE
jgi:hypothetical protein